jgi:threonine dehydratase
LKIFTSAKCKVLKFRGAINKLLTSKESKTICLSSAGTHAHAVALASNICKVKSILYMPCTTNQSLIDASIKAGTEIIYGGETISECHKAAKRDCEDHPEYDLIHSYHDLAYLAGEGTIGLEILDQLPDVETIVVPVGVGGLISSVAVALKS